ncbi:MAG: hypothetical protein PHE47_08700 [Oscillospiraceae bacterium]|nr:hypothetical protein [Oscillospiraceae bacterium]
MRTQRTRPRAGRTKKILLAGAVSLLLLEVAFLAWRLVFYQPPYQPPAYEPAVQVGVPDPPEGMGYGQISAENGFSFWVAGAMYQQEDGSLLVYLTNPADSVCNILCEITDQDGHTLYRSGALRPGEFVERLYPLKQMENTTIEIQMNVYAFEPETWFSVGTITLNNTLHQW